MKLYKDHHRNGHWRLWSIFTGGSEAPSCGYADFGTFKVYDRDVALYAKKHLKLLDRLNMEKVTEAVMYSFSILSRSVKPPEGDNWKF